MHYVVLDMEWNQPLYPGMAVQKPVYLQGEIIQIGAVKLDASFRALECFKVMVAPKYYRKMNKHVAKLTAISPEDLAMGLPFPEAFQHFKDWCGEDFTFLIWGYNDIAILRDNMRLHRLETAWLPKVYNVQVIYDTQIAKAHRQCALSTALEQLGEEIEQAHDALGDALSTVRVCDFLDMDAGLAAYDESTLSSSAVGLLRRDELGSCPTKVAAMEDEAISGGFACPVCGGAVTCGEWLSQGTDKKITLAVCEGGEALYVRLKFTKAHSGKLQISRLLYLQDEENAAQYQTRLAEKEAKLKAYNEAIAKAKEAKRQRQRARRKRQRAKPSEAAPAVPPSAAPSE